MCISPVFLVLTLFSCHFELFVVKSNKTEKMIHNDRFCLCPCVILVATKRKGIIFMTYEDLRKKLLDYYGTAAGASPAAWGDVIAVERASHAELLRMAREAGIDTSGLMYD